MTFDLLIKKGSLGLMAILWLFTGIHLSQARILLFQDDDFATVDSSSIVLGSNDAGASNTSIRFGNDGTPSENGTITWNISTNRFGIDKPIDITGALTATGNISTSGSGTITSAGLLTASDGFTLTTGALNLTATSGALNLSGLSSSSLSTGSNPLNFSASNFNTTATGINSTAIGATTPSTGDFTTLSATTSTTLGSGGTVISKHFSVTQANVATSNITVSSCGTYATISVPGVAIGDTIIASPQAAAGGIETVNLPWYAFVSGSDTVTIRACNILGLLGINTADTQTWRIDVWQH